LKLVAERLSGQLYLKLWRFSAVTAFLLTVFAAYAGGPRVSDAVIGVDFIMSMTS
jgi:hypothetical protein